MSKLGFEVFENICQLVRHHTPDFRSVTSENTLFDLHDDSSRVLIESPSFELNKQNDQNVVTWGSTDFLPVSDVEFWFDHFFDQICRGHPKITHINIMSSWQTLSPDVTVHDLKLMRLLKSSVSKSHEFLFVPIPESNWDISLILFNLKKMEIFVVTPSTHRRSEFEQKVIKLLHLVLRQAATSSKVVYFTIPEEARTFRCSLTLFFAKEFALSLSPDVWNSLDLSFEALRSYHSDIVAYSQRLQNLSVQDSKSAPFDSLPQQNKPNPLPDISPELIDKTSDPSLLTPLTPKKLENFEPYSHRVFPLPSQGDVIKHPNLLLTF